MFFIVWCWFLANLTRWILPSHTLSLYLTHCPLHMLINICMLTSIYFFLSSWITNLYTSLLYVLFNFFLNVIHFFGSWCLNRFWYIFIIHVLVLSFNLLWSLFFFNNFIWFCYRFYTSTRFLFSVDSMTLLEKWGCWWVFINVVEGFIIVNWCICVDCLLEFLRPCPKRQTRL